MGEIAARLGIAPEDLIPYGHDKAKISARCIRSLRPQSVG
jgi:formate--tetrahydrofolate ligase